METDAARSAAPLTWIAAALGCAFCALTAQVGADGRWLAAVGAGIAQLRRLPDAVPYAAAPSAGWHDAPVLGQLVFHALESVGGDRGLLLAQTIAVGIALAAVAFDLRRTGAGDVAGAAVLLAVVVAAPAALLVARAELFSLALFPVLVLLVRTGRRLWLAVPLLVVWANLHGGVLVGFGVIAGYLVLHELRPRPFRTAALLAGGAAALLATPQLGRTALYYSGVLHGETAAQHYGLWAPLSLHRPLDVLFLALAVPLVAAALWSRPAAWEIVLLLALAALSLRAERNGIWLLLFAAAPAGRALTRRPGRAALSRRTAAVAAVAPALLIGLGATHRHDEDGAGAPLLARTAKLAAGSPVLADPLDAEKLALRGTRIWIGNPIDAFSRAEQRLYLRWLRGDPGGDAILRPAIRVVLVTRGSRPQELLAREAAFRELARDGRTVLYLRRV